ncbi:hypothetical protein [Pseudanabaena sp. PCC 6802]|uniref:hypothetical protein n=1 Tax=Pseudanabaena sp. PCC 6802 TaxID=118173 RepID=UPI00035F64D9|nr:hypothetical protein [Pseudanabaena sp. PCC 6802]
MLQLLYPVIHFIQPLLVPICAGFAWLFTFLLVWSLFSTLTRGAAQVKRLHQIPCPNCQFFSGDYRLKCTIRPSTALSEEAINCIDYKLKGY